MAFQPKEPGFFTISDLQGALEYIEENLLEALTPGLIAARFFVSPSTLSSLFKLVCGMTVMEYIRNRRLTLAAAELSSSGAPVIELAYKYGYDTPEAFTKAFSRFHGFPPSFVRRGFPVSKVFLPLRVDVALEGGWACADLTKSNPTGQEQSSLSCYDTFIKDRGGRRMDSQNIYRIDLSRMQFQREWGILCALAEDLIQSRIPFKVDGKTMIFAHGLEFPLEKICLTFQWDDEERVRRFFRYDSETRHTGGSFQYFDGQYRDMRVRCMFYDVRPGQDSEALLYRNTDSVQVGALLLPVQSLEFYYENAEKDTPFYSMVARRLGKPGNYRARNKRAWEYSAYEFWLKTSGQPAERAEKSLENPLGMLGKYAAYFDGYEGVRIANICGSCGKKAVALAILGAEVTVFDISEDNRRYALEVAAAAKVALDYQVCDVLDMDMEKYRESFDVVFMEGGVLHYFHDLDEFMGIMYALLKWGGKMICSDFHPFSKISDILELEQPSMSYFSMEVFEGEMAHARFYPDDVRSQMPKCLYRKYTISEIINAIVRCGFLLEKFDEHPAWTDDRLPGEFTAVAVKRLIGP